MSVRVRFAPSPTGQVHIGNIRVAIFNWLYARHAGGKFILRIEDTDLERSTPEAIDAMLNAMRWLGIDYDEEPMYQTAQRGAHEGAARQMLDDGHAFCAGKGEPTYLKIHPGLFDPSFVSEPGEEVERKFGAGQMLANDRAVLHITTSPKSGETYTTPVLWDAMTDPIFVLEDGRTVDGIQVQADVLKALDGGSAELDLNAHCGGTITHIRFKRRVVFFDDMVLGRLEKPLDSLRDLTILRSDSSPIFHLANVCDDICQEVSHILRGNDHVENTYRHLFIYKALGKAPPQFGHFPMIVNAKGKPYSKRDGDAYVGDFREKGVLPEALFNFLALCGWSPGDDREVMTRQEMVEAFTAERVNGSAAQLNLDKLDWMNSQYLGKMSLEELTPLIGKELEAEGVPVADINKDWLRRLIAIEKEKLRTIVDFVHRTRFFFQETVEFNDKAVKKFLKKRENEGLKTLLKLRTMLAALPDWSAASLEAAVNTFAEENEFGMGQVAQPLRVACTGSSVSPGIGDTLDLLGKETTLARIDHTLATFPLEDA